MEEDRRHTGERRLQVDRRSGCWARDPDRVAEQERLVIPIGQTLFTIRERLGWPREKAAEAAGLHVQTWESLENGRTRHPDGPRVCDPQLSSYQCAFSVFGYQLSLGVVRAPRKPLARDLTRADSEEPAKA